MTERGEPNVLPGSVLFACTHNAIRSAMAEAIMKHLFGHLVYVDSAGVRKGEPDGFAIEVMDEVGIDLSGHRPKNLDDLEDTSYDLIISLSPEAQHKAVEFTRTMACEVEFWNTLDPSMVEGSRERVLSVYRDVRDQLMERIKQRFGSGPSPEI